MIKPIDGFFYMFQFNIILFTYPSILSKHTCEIILNQSSLQSVES